MLAQQQMELMHQRGIYPRRIHGGVRVDRIRRHALVNEPRLALHTSAMSLRIAVAVLTPLITVIRARHHGTATHIGRYAASVEATATFTDRLASLSIPNVTIEAPTVARRDAHSVVAIVAAVWQTTRGCIIIAISVLANASVQVCGEAIVTAPAKS